MLGTAHRSMTITGTVAEWETWTGMAFPETGRYVVPDALGLVDIDRDTDTGTYLEDNLWVQHTCAAGSGPDRGIQPTDGTGRARSGAGTDAEFQQ